MDRLKYILIVFFLLLVCACEKDASPVAFTTGPELRVPTDYGRTFIRLHGRLSGLDGIREVGFVYWRSGYAADSVKVAVNIPFSSDISAWVEGLKGDELYDYYMYIGNGTDLQRSVTMSFKTPVNSIPLLSEITSKGGSSNIFSVRVKDDGVADGLRHITQKGICWNTQGSPVVSDDKIVSAGDASGFEVTLLNLQEHTVYYLRAFAENDNSELAYGPELKIETGKTFPLVGEVVILDPIKKLFALSVINQGGSDLISTGFCWNTEGSPTVQDSKQLADESFSATLDMLQPDSTYYIRAFAENSYGIDYSREISIHITTEPKLGEIEQIDTETHTFRSTVTDDGGSEIMERGFCWNNTGEPTISDRVLLADEYFIASLGELEPGVYYVRSFAINETRVGYSSNVIQLTIETAEPENPEMPEDPQD